ncbi:DNA (cytosine-5-)-methyltransferase [Bacillus cereus]
MEQAGHKCLGYVEKDKFARKSYEAIHNTKGEWTAHDITAVTNDDLRLLRGQVDVICGGFPCQAFSIAGKRLGFAETRGTLFFEIARFAKEIQPQYLFLENVKGLLNHDGGNTFRTILSTLDELGYDAEWQVLNSKDFGVPQNRERVFIIGHLRGTCGREVFPIRRKNEGSINIVGYLSEGYKDVNYVLDPKGISKCLLTMGGGNREPKVLLEPFPLTKEENAYCLTTRTHACYLPKNVDRKETTLVKVQEVTKKSDEPKIIQYNLEMPVTVRKYEVDVENLKILLKESKINSGKSIKQIADELEVKKTTVEHWFRSDQCFSIPDADIWFELKKVLNIENTTFDASITEFIEKPNEYEKAGRVYHVDGLAPTLTRTSADEKIIQPVLTPDRAEKRQNGRRIKEPGEPMFTLTAQDRHGVMIIDDTQGFDGVRYYENEAPTIRSQRSGLKVVHVKEATKKGYAEAQIGDSINFSVPNSKTRIGRVGKGVAQTLDTSCNQATIEGKPPYRIRKLTPRECWRLQGFPDWAFDRAREVNSDSQLYKQAGNSVTVNVIHAIAERLV